MTTTFLMRRLQVTLGVAAFVLLAAASWAGATTCAVPGAFNPAVTQANIADTICKPGWTKTVRPPVEYTDGLKKKLLGKNYSKANMAAFELDHAVPLETAGNPTSTDNLWLQKWTGPMNAHQKDRLENEMHRLVCSGKVTLKQAQDCFMNCGWVACYKQWITNGRSAH